MRETTRTSPLPTHQQGSLFLSFFLVFWFYPGLSFHPPPPPPMEEVGLLVLILILFYVLIPFLIHTSDLFVFNFYTCLLSYISVSVSTHLCRFPCYGMANKGFLPLNRINLEIVHGQDFMTLSALYISSSVHAGYYLSLLPLRHPRFFSIRFVTPANPLIASFPSAHLPRPFPPRLGSSC